MCYHALFEAIYPGFSKDHVTCFCIKSEHALIAQVFQIKYVELGPKLHALIQRCKHKTVSSLFTNMRYLLLAEISFYKDLVEKTRRDPPLQMLV
jgi:hypothetical protein